MGVGVADAVFAPAPPAEQPHFIDTILASRAVVAALRIAIIFGATFVAVSVIALIARRQWLARVGPVEVERVSGLDVKNQRLEEELEAANQNIVGLENRAAYMHQLIEKEKRR